MKKKINNYNIKIYEYYIICIHIIKYSNNLIKSILNKSQVPPNK